LFSGLRHVISSLVSAHAISIDSLEKSFPPSYGGWRAFLQPFAAPTSAALRGVAFEVAPGESVALLGANGAGKSTLLRILATLLLPTRGKASLAGHDVVDAPREVRRNLGYHAGTDLGFYARLTGRQNLRFFGRLNHLSDSLIGSRASFLAERFELGSALDKQVRLLSSGTVQKLSLLRALLHQPKVLLLDEPTRSLDAFAAASFRQFLKTEVLRAQGTSLLFASHSLAEIELLADRVAVLHDGKLLAFDSPARLKREASAATLEEVFFRLTGHSAPSISESNPA
jgi:ABC-type multidrug transport system ATPase subunit